MQLGMLAAFAALTTLAAPASAARFYEFEIIGQDVGVASDALGRNTAYGVFSRLVLRFDSQLSQQVEGNGLRYIYGTAGWLDSIAFGSPGLSLRYDFKAIANADQPVALPVTGTYGISSCIRDTCTSPTRGTLLSFKARTTDVALTPGLEQQTSYYGVPEPASWAMMIGGFGLVGGALRRRAMVRTTASQI